MPYCLYLRKSRADLEAEARGEGETLARHERALLDLARRHGVAIVPSAIYRELGSGDSIADRPVVQRVLREVEAGVWDGVYVMDADRLARGETIDQGRIAQAFRYSNTKIITPFKTYDPTNESDEEYFEFSLFMARREYKSIVRRLNAGRLASVREGKYMGTRPVFGYERVKVPHGKGYTLKVVPEKAEIVRSMFKWYAGGDSSQVIADRLNALGVKTDRGNPFTGSSIRYMLKSPAYIGKVQWNQRKTAVSIVDGAKVRTRPRSDAHVLVDGLHEPIIDNALFERVQTIFATHPPNPTRTANAVRNPLAGLIKCEVCGKALVRRKGVKGRADTLRCSTPRCPAALTSVGVVEEAVLGVLRGWLIDYANSPVSPAERTAPHTEAITAAKKELAALRSQKSRLHDLLERGLYTDEVFVERSRELDGRITAAQTALDEVTASTLNAQDIIPRILPRVRYVLDAYALTKEAEDRNQLLKSIISHIVLHKTKRCTRGDNPAEHTSIDVFPLAQD